MPITLFFGMTFEHSVVNMFLFPSALMMGGHFRISDYIRCRTVSRHDTVRCSAVARTPVLGLQ